ncbi:MAG TPA: FAD-dependent oxidoreductase [Gemmataceae bacterium]|nr:FAD-dependent oxidoreductase [Gemmataceae bacterium]
MRRRTFLRCAALGSLALPQFTFAEAPRARERRADVVIVGGGVGGVAAALAAARHGLRVILTEETDWLGGQLTAQAVPPDEHPWIESFGCTRLYRRFRDGVRAYYRRHYPLTAEARAAAHLNPGNGRVSRLCHEPRVALAVLHELLAPHVSARRLLVLRNNQPVAADVEGDRVRSVTVRDLRTGRDTVLSAPYFLDATELGDLLPLTKTEYVTGFESQKETGEPHAPAEARPHDHQAFTCCFAIDYRDGEDHTIDKPAEYDFWRKYVPALKPAWPGKLLSWSMSDPISLKERKVSFDPTGPGTGLNLWLYRRIIDRRNFAESAAIGDVCLVNWPQNDYWLGNLYPPFSPPRGRGEEGGGEGAAKHLRRAKQLSLSLLYWMQTEAPRPDGKAGWKGLRLREDVVGTDDGLAKCPYVRESRRIRAEFTVLEQHVGTDARMKLTGKKRDELTAERFADSVGVGSYRIDLHPSSGGVNYIDISSLPFQIPLGALLPRRVENLLPACKNLGVTHITNGCYRLHPVEWNVGESAGALAAFCLRRKEPPRQVRKDRKLLAELQKMLRDDGVELEWPKVTPR